MKTILLTLILLTAACSYLPEVVEPASVIDVNNVSDAANKTRLYIANHGWHTGVIFESSVLKDLIPELAMRFAGSDYLEVGWGDAGFYQAEEISFGLVVQALLWPTESVVHVVGLSEPPETYFSASTIKSLAVRNENIRTLARFIQSSFALDNKGAPQPLQEGIYGNSQFYRGVGSYYLFNTCNSWTAKALYSAGFEINPVFKLTASSITGFLNDLKL
jgi:uncharacterized protein (TIGR02117 family)